MSQEIEIKYQKSVHFNSGLVTGAFGGLSNQGFLTMNLYLDKPPLPEGTKVRIDEKGNIIGEEEFNRPARHLKEVQFEAYMDINTAKAIYKWIGDKIDIYEKATGNK